MRPLLLSLLLLLATPIWAQETVIKSRIVDAETGEALPFARVYVSPLKGTISNEYGDFRIAAGAGDTLRISFIGYERLRIPADSVPQRVEMKRAEQILTQVTVMDKEGIMERIAKHLQKAYKKYKGEESRYFMRQTNALNGHVQMIEAYIEANSAVNMRKISFLSGRHFREDVGLANHLNDQAMLEFSNTQLLLSLAPQVKGEYAWINTTIMPFNTLPNGRGMGYKSRYNTDITPIKGEDGREVLKVRMEAAGNEEKESILCGTLYVDAKTLAPLKFDGRLEHFRVMSAVQDVKRVQFAENEIHISYDNTKGFPRITHISTSMSAGRMECKTLVYCTDGMKTPLPKNSERMANMIKAIQRVGYDEKLWKDPIVMRTTREENLLRGKKTAGDLTRRWTPLRIERPDSLSLWTMRADSAALQYPQEKVYLHLDNTCYFLGEAIRFKAYLRRTDKDRPSTISNVLYVDLLNHDGYLMERKIIRMKNGEGHGSFVLRDDSTMYSGFYELRAYTRWQLNWGRFEHPHSNVSNYWFHNKEMAKDYFRDYEKLYSRVVPVYDKPLSPGDYTRDMTLRRMMRYYPANDEKPKLKLSFYPEGGNLVQGVENRVAFEAMTEEGENVSGKLTVNGQTVATVHRGRGMFTVTPSGSSMDAEFRSEDGRSVKESLPKAEADGVALAVETDKETTVVRVRANGAKVPAKLALAVRHEGKPTHYHTMPSNQENRIVLQNAELPTGVNQVTVYDAEGRVWADRLFFHRTDGLGTPSLQIEGVKDEYTPQEHITFKIKGQEAGAKFSLSVRDAYSSDEIFDNGSILTEMLLSSELRGFVPNPGWYFEKDDEQHHEALDLLMLTQGWRRFNWKEMASGSFRPTEPAEKHMQVKGEVRKYRAYRRENNFDKYHNAQWEYENLNAAGSKATLKEVLEEVSKESKFGTADEHSYRGGGYKAAPNTTRVHMEFIKDTLSVGLRTDVKNGVFQTLIPNFTESCILHMGASDTAKWDKDVTGGNYPWILPDETEYPEFYVRLSKPHPRFPKPYSFYHTHLPQNEKPREYDGLAEPGVHQMQQVSVRSKHGRLIKRMYVGPALSMDAYQAFNAAVEAGLLDGYYPGATAFKDAVGRCFIGDMGINTRYEVNVLPRFSSWGENSNTLDLQSLKPQDDGPRKRVDPTRVTVNPWELNDLSGINTNALIDNGVIDSDEEANLYHQLMNLDSVFIYTDYSPRFEGDKKFEKPNLPEVTVYLKRYYDQSVRETFRDRFMVLPGYCIPEDFYHVDYSKFKLPEGTKDHRRTLYWHPDVTLDDNGEATISLYNNSGTTHIAIEMNGQTEDGTLLWGREGANPN